MPNGWKNWTYSDVTQFLRQHYFELLRSSGSSHRLFRGFVGKQDRLVTVPYHAKVPIKPRTLKDGIVRQSGIPEDYWLRWAMAGQTRLRKKIHYPAALPLPGSHR